MILLKIKYRLRYYYNALLVFFGICPKCWTVLNRKRNGIKVCPNRLWHRRR
jgi:hypothetical protein